MQSPSATATAHILRIVTVLTKQSMKKKTKSSLPSPFLLIKLYNAGV